MNTKERMVTVLGIIVYGVEIRDHKPTPYPVTGGPNVGENRFFVCKQRIICRDFNIFCANYEGVHNANEPPLSKMKKLLKIKVKNMNCIPENVKPAILTCS